MEEEYGTAQPLRWFLGDKDNLSPEGYGTNLVYRPPSYEGIKALPASMAIKYVTPTIEEIKAQYLKNGWTLVRDDEEYLEFQKKGDCPDGHSWSFIHNKKTRHNMHIDDDWVVNLRIGEKN